MPNVKPLEWGTFAGERVAETPFGAYRFFEKFSLVAGKSIPVIVFSCCDETNLHLTRESELTFEAACKIAQEDFNVKVLACLG